MSVAPAPPRMPSLPPSRDWYVYSPDGRHIGPLSTDTLARAWLGRKVPVGAWVGATGEQQWWPLDAVPEILDAARVIQASGG